MIAIGLNCLINNVFTWKAHSENYLRNSGLNYAIVRPPQLVGEYSDFGINKYYLSQGDKILGKITRSTLAAAVLDCLKQTNIDGKITFECTQDQQENDVSFH